MKIIFLGVLFQHVMLITYEVKKYLFSEHLPKVIWHSNGLIAYVTCHFETIGHFERVIAILKLPGF